MAGRICAAVEEGEALGLSLAGVREMLIWNQGDDPEEVRGWYLEMMEKDMGVMILSMHSADALKEELFKKRSEGIIKPVVVTIPGKGEDWRANELIRRAIGMNPSKEDEPR